MKGIAYLVLLCCILAFGSQLDQPYLLIEAKYFPEPIPYSNTPTVNGVDLGRHLFYDPVLSKDSSISCASCHQQSAAFADEGKRFSIGVHGDNLSRNTPALFNLSWLPSFFWDGRAESVEAQALHPVRNKEEMDLHWTEAVQRIRESEFYQPKLLNTFGTIEVDSHQLAAAIAQFERSLISSNSKYDKALRGEAFFTPDEYQGFLLANEQTKGACMHCHPTDAHPLGTNGLFSNNGLDKSEDFTDLGRGAITGEKKDDANFKTPSLRNVGLTAPYMHDGRFQTLEEVLDFYSEGVKESYSIDSKMTDTHRGGMQLSEEEKQQIISFLHTLSDSSFIQNPAFSNPFQ